MGAVFVALLAPFVSLETLAVALFFAAFAFGLTDGVGGRVATGCAMMGCVGADGVDAGGAATGGTATGGTATGGAGCVAVGDVGVGLVDGGRGVS